MTDEQMRAAFEAWAASIGLRVDGWYAESLSVLCAEEAFKAGYQAALAKEVAHATAALHAENEKLRAELERLRSYYKNGIECFANPCEKHSGENTPPFDEFFVKYGGQCLICVVDNNKALQAENEKLRAEVERLKRILGRIVEGDGDSTVTIRAGADAFAAAREYLRDSRAALTKENSND